MDYNLKMVRNYFKIAWRILLKQKLYSSIKIGGFSLGIAACLLISLFIQDELSYDQHYPNKNRLYRVISEANKSGKITKGISFPAPMAKALKNDYPEIEQVGRFNPNELFGAGSAEVRRGDKRENFYEEKITYADQGMLDILQVPMVYGDPKKALAEPNTIVISKTKADKYFPNENPVGKTLILNNNEKKPYKIGGVMEDFPSTSHLDFDFLLTLTGVEFWPGEQGTWMASNYATYIMLRPGADAAALEKKFPLIIEKYVIPSLIEAGNVDVKDVAKQGKIVLQPITDIHLNSADIMEYGSNHQSDIRFVWLFGAIAAFILIIAGINFINLSTAKSANRAKEVGLRKVLGTYRSNLVQQFLAESILYSAISFAVGLLLAWLLLPFFNTLAAKSLVFPWREWWLLPTMASAALVIGFLAGLYPSFYLSSFKPINVLKGNVSRGSKSAGTRSALVVFQFTASIILIVGTFIIYRQMNFILNKKIGFEKDQVLLIQGTHTLGDKVKTFKTELLRLPEVKSVSISDYLPIKGMKRNGNGFWKEGKHKEESATYGQMWRIDHDYIKTLGMKIVAGRDFSQEMATDSGAAIVNQALVKEMGLKNPIGARISNSWEHWTIVGVVEDFHFESLKENIRPMIMDLGHSPSVVAVKVKSADMPEFVQSVSSVWKSFAPDQAIRYTFLDQSYANMYADVQRMGRIFSSFAILAVIVACLGLFALSAFMVEQRSKEISIRLVLGASGYSIFRLLTQNFLKLVLIALVIAAPVAWYLMQKWLEDYEYRITINLDVFLIAGILAVVIAILTISYQSVRAAFMKPVDGLRAE